MGKTRTAKTKRSKTGDPVVDQLAVIDAKNMFVGNLISMGWRLACMVIIPIFAGVQLDKHFDTKPQLTLVAFFIAIFGSGVLIYRNYVDMQREQTLSEMKKSKRKLKRSANV